MCRPATAARCRATWQNRHFDGEDAAVKGQHYLYAHDYPNHWVEQQYLPDALRGKTYYTLATTKPSRPQPPIGSASKKDKISGSVKSLRELLYYNKRVYFLTILYHGWKKSKIYKKHENFINSL